MEERRLEAEKLKDWIRKVDENIEEDEKKRLKKEANLRRQLEQDSKILS